MVRKVPTSFLQRFVKPLLYAPSEQLQQATDDTRKNLLSTNLFENVSITAQQSPKQRTVSVSVEEKPPPRYKFSFNSSVDSKAMRPVFSGSGSLGLGVGRSLSMSTDYMSAGAGGVSSSSASGIRFGLNLEDSFLFGRDLPFNLSTHRLHESIEWLDASHSSTQVEANISLPRFFQSLGFSCGKHTIAPKTLATKVNPSLPQGQAFASGILCALRHSFHHHVSWPFSHNDSLPSSGLGLRMDHELGLSDSYSHYLRAFASVEQNFRMFFSTVVSPI
ncbi:hypothetical protein GEMRC1_014184 [Eukaryota sp. GEM-RC1]